MAILASRRRHPIVARNRMFAARVSLLRIRMALPTRDLLRRCVVHQALDIGVAVNARKQAPVDGVLQLAHIDKQAQRLPVHIGRQRGVRVAGEAVCILRLLCTMRQMGPGKQR